VRRTLTAILLFAFGCGDEDPTGTGGATSATSSSATVGNTGGAGGASTCLTDATPSETVAITDRGALEGVADGGVVRFFGIPYAAPPIGALRFRPPEEHGCFDGVRPAKEPGAACPQLGPGGAFRGDEDCLTLNVVRPAGDGAPRPVLVYIHGGGNIQGSANEVVAGTTRLFDGKHLAEERDVVVVTIQYRLGALGFLSQPALDAESTEGVSGNYATRDQIAALEWVQRNIAAFGGDPSRVLLFGESAGAVNTCTLLASPRASGLFHAALMQSGSCRQPSVDASRAWMTQAIADSACGTDPDPVTCLRGLDAEAVVRELPGAFGVFDISFSPVGRYGPVVDGVILPQSPETALAAGAFEPVPFVVGANAEELAALITTTVETEPELVAAIEQAMAPFGAQATEDAVALYPAASYPTPQDALVAFLSDQRFVCPSRRIARLASGHGSPVYRYFFSRRAQGAMGALPAQHGIELLFVFGTMADIPGFTPAPADVALASAMRGYWTSLARSGTPSENGQPAWPAYEASSDHTLVLDAPISVLDGVRTTECDFWDTLIPPG
jgi:para-nitrobenzyl esterase